MAKSRGTSASRSTRKNVYIVEHETEQGVEYRACPPAIVLTGGDTFQIVNMTGLAWDWKLWGRPDGLSVALPVGPNATTVVWRELPALPLQAYDYTLTSVKGAITAKGFSDPMIIVDPNG